MARDRKAIEARKRRERQQEQISRRNEYGFSDPTAYQAIRNIMHEQKKQAAHRPNRM